MPPNSQQRAIFVYLRSKNDHKSCTPAGAKLTDEYTHRNNKNNPSTISVTPSQLCTFFRKRTGCVRVVGALAHLRFCALQYCEDFHRHENGVSYRGKWNFPGRNGEIHRNFDFILPKFHFILPTGVTHYKRIADFGFEGRMKSLKNGLNIVSKTL